ncbi:alpha/beta hydrolase-fold protein [Acidianus sp. RZ1]|uniref:alpha/beta hydrolase-fold protein n=1 Tax=Acidianus sp. RZ1 TaxID=1540082 RepID=UPI0014914225|nr:alpha/beta hydrolase-fold protein [Acidianus sp. RZ1]NON62891.1 hypothetical protein [Acidianus sp. RZ1]
MEFEKISLDGKEAIIMRKGKENKLIVVLEPYGFHPGKPFLNLIDIPEGYMVVEPDGSLGKPCNFISKDDRFSNLMKGSWFYGNYSDVVLRVIERFAKEVNHVILAGASMGGWGALNIASKYPEKFDAVIVSSAPSMFGKSFFNVKGNSELLAKMMDSDKDTAIAYFTDMLETMDNLFSEGKLLSTVKIDNEKVSLDESLYSAWKKEFPINKVNSDLSKTKLFISVNWFDTTTMLSNEKLHEKLREINVAHEYQVFLGKKKGSHYYGMIEGIRRGMEFLKSL